MLTRLIYNQKYQLIAGTVVLLLLCYQLAFKKTIQAIGVSHQLKEQLTQQAGISYQPGYLERKEKNLDILLGRYQMDSLAFRGNAIANIAVHAERQGVKLSEVPLQDPVFNTDRMIIQKLDFEGDYVSLIKTLKVLENGSGTGMPRAITMKVVDVRTASAVSKKVILEVLIEIKK